MIYILNNSSGHSWPVWPDPVVLMLTGAASVEGSDSEKEGGEVKSSDRVILSIQNIQIRLWGCGFYISQTNTPALVDKFRLFFADVKLSVGPTFCFLVPVVSGAISVRRAGAEEWTARASCGVSVWGGCRAEVPGVWSTVIVEGAPRSTVWQNGTGTERIQIKFRKYIFG